MFTIEQVGAVVRLGSPGSVLDILPTCGGILNSWKVDLHGQRWDIIDGYDSTEDFSDNCESKGFRSCKLSPYVCRIPNRGKYSFEGQTYQVGKFDLAGSSIHGLLYDVSFDIAFTEANEEHATIALQHHYEGTDPGYPFPYFIEVVYYLLPENMVKITTTLYNQHEGPIPVADGWHPYFSLGRPIDQLHFEMASDQMLVFDESLIPTGAYKQENRFEFLNSLEDVSLDNCFKLHDPQIGPACSLVNREDKIALSITPEEGYPYLQVYTPPHRNSIAIENLSAAPDVFNNKMGLIILEPDDQVMFSTTYQVTEWK